MFQEMQFLILFVIQKPYKNVDVQQTNFLQDLGLVIVKINLPLQFVENVCFECLIYIHSLKLSSLLKNSFLKKYYLTWWRK
jgi:hypothetical protein